MADKAEYWYEHAWEPFNGIGGPFTMDEMKEMYSSGVFHLGTVIMCKRESGKISTRTIEDLIRQDSERNLFLRVSADNSEDNITRNMLLGDEKVHEEEAEKRREAARNEYRETMRKALEGYGGNLALLDDLQKLREKFMNEELVMENRRAMWEQREKDKLLRSEEVKKEENKQHEEKVKAEEKQKKRDENDAFINEQLRERLTRIDQRKKSEVRKASVEEPPEQTSQTDNSDERLREQLARLDLKKEEEAKRVTGGPFQKPSRSGTSVKIPTARESMSSSNPLPPPPQPAAPFVQSILDTSVRPFVPAPFPPPPPGAMGFSPIQHHMPQYGAPPRQHWLAPNFVSPYMPFNPQLGMAPPGMAPPGLMAGPPLMMPPGMPPTHLPPSVSYILQPVPPPEGVAKSDANFPTMEVGKKKKK